MPTQFYHVPTIVFELFLYLALNNFDFKILNENNILRYFLAIDTN